MSRDGKGGSTITYYSRTNGHTPMPRAGVKKHAQKWSFLAFVTALYLLFTLVSLRCVLHYCLTDVINGRQSYSRGALTQG
jgi:hypothetical protein